MRAAVIDGAEGHAVLHCWVVCPEGEVAVHVHVGVGLGEGVLDVLIED